MRHAGPIGIAKQLVAQVKRFLERRYLAEARARLRLENLGNVPNGLKAAQPFRHHVRVHDGIELPGHEQPAPQQIGARKGPAVFEQSRRLGTCDVCKTAGLGDEAKRLAKQRDAGRQGRKAHPARNVAERRISAEHLVPAHARLSAVAG